MKYKLKDMPDLVNFFDNTTFIVDLEYPEIAHRIWCFWGTIDLYEYISSLIVIENEHKLTSSAFSELYKITLAHDQVYPDISNDNNEKILGKNKFVIDRDK